MPRRLSFRWKIILAFFLGAFVSNIAYDFSSYVYYNISSSGIPLTPYQQSLYFQWIPGLFYLSLAGLAYLMARLGYFSPASVIYFYIFLVLAAYLLGLQLPQASSTFWLFTATAGTFIAGGIALGLVRQVHHGN